MSVHQLHTIYQPPIPEEDFCAPLECEGDAPMFFAVGAALFLTFAAGFVMGLML